MLLQVTFLGVSKKFTICQEAKQVNTKQNLHFECLEPHHFVPEIVETYPYEQLGHAVLNWVEENADRCDVIHGHEWGGAFVDLITANNHRQVGAPFLPYSQILSNAFGAMGDHLSLLGTNSCLSGCYVWSCMGEVKDALGLTEARARMPADQGGVEGCGAAARRALLVVHGAGPEAHGHRVAAHRQSGTIPQNGSHRAHGAQGAHQKQDDLDIVSLRIDNQVY